MKSEEYDLLSRAEGYLYSSFLKYQASKAERRTKRDSSFFTPLFPRRWMKREVKDDLFLSKSGRGITASGVTRAYAHAH